MADIKTAWSAGEQRGQWTVSSADLASDDGLETAVLLSLFTDAAASEEELAAAGLTNRRGWWGDAWAVVAGDAMGSKLWLLRREKLTAGTVTRARQYVLDALAWLVQDGVADGVEVTAEVQGLDRLALAVVVVRRDRPAARFRFERFWQGV